MNERVRILAISTGNIGDLLAAVPAMCALHRGFGVPLTALTKPLTAPLLSGHPSVEEILTDDPRQREDQIVAALRARSFSYAIIFWSTARNARIAQRAKIPIRVGPAGRLYSWFRYTVTLRMRADRGDAATHASENLMDNARALGVTPIADDYRVGIRLNAQDDSESRRLLAQLGVQGRFVALQPVRGLRAGVRWPVERFAAIGDALGERFGLPVVLVGSDDEVPTVRAVAAAMRRANAIAAGRTSLRELAAILSKATVAVMLDSGPAHIAAAVGVPTVAIFALRTDLPGRWRPLGPRVTIVEPSYSCPGCRKETCMNFACYDALSPATIVAKALAAAALAS